ncbi:uncharacterized protein LOC129601968 [Paramacrobiotus metropolitanus]|uniref:uncharacterized protein LOC129601968 n=1 Tax=Paramacrobiotus metropolitanus TaxID=2943436 RepID=UPI00244599C8|nr:uncharacterized protein LOC129601968 [Paramacrobiotus metropolitanus]
MRLFDVDEPRDGFLSRNSGDIGPCIDNAIVAAERAIRARLATIKILREMAGAFDEVTRQEKITTITGGTVSVIGSVLGIAGGVLTIATAGAAAAPAAVAYLLWSGTGVGLAGGITKGIGSYLSTKKQKDLIERLDKAVHEDDEAHKRLTKLLEVLSADRFSTTRFIVFKHAAIPVVTGGNAVAYVMGGAALVEIVSRLVPSLLQHVEDEKVKKALGATVALLTPLLIKNFTITTPKTGASVVDDIARGAVDTFADGPTKKLAYIAAKKAATAVMKDGGDDAARALTAKAAVVLQEKVAAEAVEKGAEKAVAVTLRALAEKGSELTTASGAVEAAKQVLKAAKGKAARKAAKAGMKKAVETLGAKTAERATAESAIKAAQDAAAAAAKELAVKAAEAAAAKQAVDATVKTAAASAAKQAAQNVVKTMARLSGGVTVAFGAFFVAWDLYSMHQDCRKESLGETLRKLASSLENVDAG